MDVANQRRMASEILKCGRNRVVIDMDRLEDVSEAVTRQDIRKLISSGAIRARQKGGVSRSRARYRAAQERKGRRRGPGHRKGGSNARLSYKERWMLRIRPIRKRLRELRRTKEIDRSTYRLLYRQAKGGLFHNRSHLETQLRLRGIIKTEYKPARKAERRRRLRKETARSVIMPSRLQKTTRKLRDRAGKKKRPRKGGAPEAREAQIAPAGKDEAAAGGGRKEE